ncbi:hypothetical protein [Pseudomonas sp. GV071]|jgi:hypothetical protein|uniref:hypothetical protein n=1 Tax=Pseudomonas sp. GV071 TaxID=2135754 RepID=UPI000D39B5DD|nr:hypothetical protein [Pseudomonas sp. GV071]PTQ73961.1 hypothetical protein C8K61_101397 [Pseudomonas sp. GV071]
MSSRIPEENETPTALLFERNGGPDPSGQEPSHENQDRKLWQVAELQKAMVEADRGDFATEEEVAAAVQTWTNKGR